MSLHEMSISAIQQALSAGELSAREIARQTLEDIARINPQINAGRRLPKRGCWPRQKISTPCAGKSAPCRRWRACLTR